jgi:hypothetical protein
MPLAGQEGLRRIFFPGSFAPWIEYMISKYLKAKGSIFGFEVSRFFRGRAEASGFNPFVRISFKEGI